MLLLIQKQKPHKLKDRGFFVRLFSVLATALVHLECRLIADYIVDLFYSDLGPPGTVDYQMGSGELFATRPTSHIRLALLKSPPSE